MSNNVVTDKRGRDRELKTPEARLERRQQLAILKDFLDPAIDAGHGVHVKNLYNLYVYFWRWALWKVFEQDTAEGPGIVSFISASSYLDGDAFSGMREHIRRQCDEVWILDLGGEGRGTRQDSNVFAIQTPVAIAVAFRAGEVETDKPAKVRYARIEGMRAEKLAALAAIDGFAKVKWQNCPDDWQASFRPAGEGAYFAWPLAHRSHAVAALGSAIQADMADCTGRGNIGTALARIVKCRGSRRGVPRDRRPYCQWDVSRRPNRSERLHADFQTTE